MKTFFDKEIRDVSEQLCQVPRLAESDGSRCNRKCRFLRSLSLTDVTIVRRERCLLKAVAKRVDTVAMSTTEATATTFDQNCLAVLECYAVRDAAAKTSNSEYAGWLDRILTVPGLDAPCLTSIHGFLIAQGLIKFEFTGRSVGLQYQLSTLGRESIARRSLCILDDSRSADGAGDFQPEGVAHAA